ncbi:MAG: gamma-glutamylcyclotransferase [Acidobacteriaceae bacterium]|nr:gamma-glutamylcyclotransferase [Acidobacteriaceae bacterium]
MSGVVINSPTPPSHLFAYGTLMKGESRHHLLELAQIKSVVPATISGELLDLGEYPGLRLSPYVKTRVCGELIELEALDRVIERLDAEEGPAFRREIVNVTTDDGQSHFAWTYVLASDASSLPVIESGDWHRK